MVKNIESVKNVKKLSINTMRLNNLLDKKEYKSLKKKLGYENDLAMPQVEKVVVNAGLGEKGLDKKKLSELKQQLANITGQIPVVRKAKNTISAFDVQEGQPVGLQVTLRKSKMTDFLNKLTMIILPSIKSFKGVPQKSVTSEGNLTIGLTDEVTYPEIDYDKVDVTTGMGVTIVTTCKNRKEANKVLTALGVVFESEEARQMRLEAEEKRKEERERLAQKRKAYKQMAKSKASDEAEETEDQTEVESEEQP